MNDEANENLVADGSDACRSLMEQATGFVYI